MSKSTPERSHVILRSRQGAHYKVPIPQLAEFSAADGTMVIEWRPGRYLVMPPERLEEFRMSDEDLLPLALEARVSRPLAARWLRGRR